MFVTVIDKKVWLVDAITRGATTVHGEAQVASAPCFDQVFGFRIVAWVTPERQITQHMEFAFLVLQERKSLPRREPCSGSELITSLSVDCTTRRATTVHGEA